jgi:hypothetical protein
MVIVQFELFVLILAATIIVFIAFCHAAFSTVLVIVVPKASIHQLIHAVVEMDSGARRRCEVKKGQYGYNNFLHQPQMYRLIRINMLYNFVFVLYLNPSPGKSGLNINAHGPAALPVGRCLKLRVIDPSASRSCPGPEMTVLSVTKYFPFQAVCKQASAQ